MLIGREGNQIYRDNQVINLKGKDFSKLNDKGYNVYR